MVLSEGSANLSVLHLEGEPGEKIQLLVRQYSFENANYKFDLANGPLFRFQLIQTRDKEFIFLINIHHIITDAISLTLFINEIKKVYESLMKSKNVDLVPLPINYTDFTLYENQWQSGEEYKQKLEYWKNELAGATEILQIPLDFPRPKKASFNGSEYHFSIDTELKEKLAVLSKNMGTGLSIPLLSAFAILLYRYSSQDDFVLGFPVANRVHPELESITGVFINTLPIRFVFPDEITIAQFIEETTKRFLSAYENQEIPLDRLIEELKLKRSMNINPLFQVLFNFLSGFPSEVQLNGANLKLVNGERIAAQFDLTLTINDNQQDFDCVFEYNTDLFKKETIERMSGHYLRILQSLLEDNTLDIKGISLLTEPEKNLILKDWNRTQAEYPSEKCIHQLFEEQVGRTPDAVAIAFENQSLTYAELNAKANQLARYLVKEGAGEGKIVTICVHRSIDLAIGLLAISKTGATYLPLDPIYPKARLSLILEDAKPVLLVSESEMSGNLPETKARIVHLNDKEKFSSESSENLGNGNSNNNAYILYTSGSTGKPKGVQIRQHSVVNLLLSMRKSLRVTARDILLAVTTISFDIAELEIFLPLISGAKLVIATEEEAMNVDLLKNKIEETEATIFQATPVTFRMLLLSGWDGKKDLKVMCGGEAFSKELAQGLLLRCEEVWNGYGPTEATIYSVIRKILKEDCEGEGYVPIGRPVDNTKLYVLNQRLMPVPIGVAGELFIGGDGVSKGYLNLNEMTNERFIPDPFSNDPDARIYKTGDLVHYFPDGTLMYLNRVDLQVKIRGYRIELGEIESAISKFTGIKENAVVVYTDEQSEKVLVAYCVIDNGTALNETELRQFLKEKLPDYMVPSAFVLMEKLPLTANKKVDRKALPEPTNLSSSFSKDYVEPTTDTEKKLTAIWSSILKIEKIGILDNFFEIGGHSMIAVNMIIRIEKEFGIRLPLATLFEQSDIQKLAKVIEDGITPDKWRSLVPLRPIGKKKPLFLIHGLGLNVLLYTTIINYLDPDQPVYGIQAKGLNGIDKSLETIEEIASYYISEIMTVDKEGPFQLAGYSLGGNIAYEMARQLTDMGKKVSFIGLLDTVAESSTRELPVFQQIRLKGKYILNYLLWNVAYLFKYSNESKLAIIQRRWRGLWKKVRGLDFKISDEENISRGEEHELPKYLHKVHQANSKADRHYVIKPYQGCVHLFKATHQTFYIPDPVNYGWDKYAVNGVIVHDIPGEHSTTFAPPNDRHFSSILQKSLDESMIQMQNKID
jgi:amino acid adenylation domain-containing protein